MNESELRLDRYFFPVVSIRADPYHSPGEGGNGTVDIEANVAPVENTNIYQLSIQIELVNDGEQKAAYTGTMQAVGFFSIEEKMEYEDACRFVHANGGLILYSMAREFLMTITSRGPWAPVMLPAFSSPETGNAGMAETAE